MTAVAAAAAKLLQSCPTLCNPIDSSPPGSTSLGFSRQEHWSGLPFPSPMHESEKSKWSRSVVSDPQRPHGLQPTRLLHPWDFPGKSTGVGCHHLLQWLLFSFPILPPNWAVSSPHFSPLKSQAVISKDQICLSSVDFLEEALPIWEIIFLSFGLQYWLNVKTESGLDSKVTASGGGMEGSPKAFKYSFGPEFSRKKWRIIITKI